MNQPSVLQTEAKIKASPVKVIAGNLLEAKDDYILHQCNCVSVKCAGLAEALFKKFPWANTYSKRTSQALRNKPGSIDILGNGQDQRCVINLYAQNYLGAPKAYETSQMRLAWFEQCLEQVKKQLLTPVVESKAITLGFPARIGCGMGHGDWATYKTVIEKFAQNNPSFIITIYDLDLKPALSSRTLI